MRTNFFLLSALAAQAASGALALSAFAEGEEERQDRIVDQASVETQTDAERELVELISQYRGTAKETGLLLRLAEMRLEIADTLFRVVYAPGQVALQKTYRATLSRAASTLSRIVEQAPKSPEFARALFLRGKAYGQLKQPKLAVKDLEMFLARYPARAEAGLAAIAIADLSIQLKNFPRAISVVKSIAANPKHPFYIHALQKRAWSMHVEGQNLAAVQELKRLAKYFAASTPEHARANSTVREAVLDDVSSIAYSAYRDDSRKFTLVQANELLRMFDVADRYRDMAAQLADRLRAADLADALHDWRFIVLKSDPAKKENLRILVSILEYELERESYGEAVEVANEIAQIVAKFPDAPHIDESKSLVLKAAESLTKRISDYRKDVKSTTAERTIRALLPAVDLLLGEKDTRRFTIRWNLAETLFALERYESAAEAYRWVYVNGQKLNLPTANEAALKAISSRYETLRALKVVPKDLTVRPSVTARLAGPKLQALREWIIWIDDLSAKPLNAQHSDNLQRFHFEANRSLYEAGFQDEALQRLRAHALSAPSSGVAMASASLVMDTWIARKNWEQVEAWALPFAAASGWKDGKFAGKMRTQAAEARFKRAEESVARRDQKSALEHALFFLKNYPQNSLALDARGIACNAQRSMQAFDATLDCLESLIREFPKSNAAKEALRTAAQIQDDRLEFLSAASYYHRYLNTAKELKTKDADGLRTRILKLARASGDADAMSDYANRGNLCRGSLRRECELNRAIAGLIRKSSKESVVMSAVRQSTKAPRELRAIFATQAIEQGKHLSPKVLNQVFGAVASAWSDTDIAIRYLLIPRLTKAIPETLAEDRDRLQDDEIESENEKILLRRLNGLRAFEARAEILGKLPLNAVRLTAFEQTFAAYNDLIEELRAIPAPKKASAAEKQEHAKMLGQMAQPFALKARQLKDQITSLSYKQNSGLDIESFEDIWSKAHAFRTPESDAIRQAWPKAIRSGEWNRVAFFADESASTKNLPKDWVKAARAMSLARSGAEAEARIIFADTCRTSSEGTIRGVCRAAVQNRKGRG